MSLKVAIQELKEYTDIKLLEYAPHIYKSEKFGSLERVSIKMKEYSQNLHSYGKDIKAKSEEIANKYNLDGDKVFLDKIVDEGINQFVNHYNR